MLIELLKNKELGFEMCLCTNHDYKIDLRTRGLTWVTRDWLSPLGDSIIDQTEYIQFPFTLTEYVHSCIEKYLCPECHSYLYRIVSKEDLRK